MYEEFPFENYYAFLCSDNDDSIAKRKIAREAHVTRLNHLKKEGRLLLAGPLLNPEHLDIPTGGLIIAQFNTLKEAKKWLNEEPYLQTNAYKTVDIHAFKNVFINSST